MIWGLSPQGVLVAVALLAVVLLGLSIPVLIQRVRSDNDAGLLLVVAAAVALLVAMVAPASALINGTRQSKLESLRYVAYVTPQDVATALLYLAVGLIAFSAGAVCAIYFPAKELKHKPDIGRFQKAHNLLCILSLVAFARGLATNQSEAFADRGSASGAGLTVLLFWTVGVGAALAISYEHFGSRPRVGFTLLSVAFLIYSGNRSPLLLLGIALLVRSIFALRARKLSTAGIFLAPVLLYGAVSLGAGMSAWRGAIGNGASASLPGATLRAARDPLTSIASSGADSVDGFIFSTYLRNQGVAGSPFDLLKGLVNLVPRQLWTDKPEWLSARLANDYFGIDRAGIFLSGQGYLSLTLGGVAPALIALFILGLALSLIVRRTVHDRMLMVLTIYFATRFLIGGDAFDLFHTLTLVIAYLFARVLVRLYDDLIAVADKRSSVIDRRLERTALD